MGNTPSQRPFESDSPEEADSGPATSLAAKAVGRLRSFFGSLRRRVLGESALGSGPADDTAETPPEREQMPARRTTVGTPEYGSVAEIPARTTPFTHPASDCADENESDLQAKKSDGRLAIYYPNCPGASIESDTWERVER